MVSGKVCPSGKLPVTFAKKYEDYPYMKYGKEAYPGVDKKVYYKEDIYVGYRGFEADKVQPQFPFGFGLSYTTFKYSKPVVSGNTVAVEVTNTGSVEGKEIVQLYVGMEKCSEDRPKKELKDFKKVSLKPGETKTVGFTINRDNLKFFSTKDGAWKFEPGTYRLYLASSSADESHQATIDL